MLGSFLSWCRIIYSTRFAYSNEGVASALISIPLKYMHTTVEMCAKDDLEKTIQLIYETVIQVKDGQDFRYIKWKSF